MKGRTGDYAILELDGAGAAQGGEVDFGGGGVRHAGIASLTGSHLAFYTNSTNSGQTVTERMRITSGGDVGIGVTPSVNLQVKTTTATNETAFRVSDDVTQTLNVIVDGTASTGGIHYQNPNLGYQRWSTTLSLIHI